MMLIFRPSRFLFIVLMVAAWLRSPGPLCGSVPFTFNNNLPQIRNLAWSERPYYASWAITLPDSYAYQDASGVRMWSVKNVLYDHPVLQGQHALACINAYALTQDQKYLDRAVLHAQRLIDTAVVSNGAWFYPYRFPFYLHGLASEAMPVPWYSAMAQGTALSVFTRLYDITKDQKYLNAAQMTVASFKVSPGSTDAWVAHVDELGYLWLDEFPISASKADLTLNGFIFGLYGLADYNQVTNDPDALVLLQGALTTLTHYLPSFRVPGYLSKYCLLHGNQYSNYHQVHVQQLNMLYTITGDSGFAKLVDAFRVDYPDDTRTGSVVLQPGVYSGYQFDKTGAITSTQSFTVVKTTVAKAQTRQTIAGHSGAYFRMNDGAWAGYWLAESYPKVIWLGFADVVRFSPLRNVTFAPGSYTFIRLDNSVHVLTLKSATFTSPQTVQFSSTGVVNSLRRIYIMSGTYKGYWVALGKGMKLD